MKAHIIPEWKGKDAFIIGGGASLRDFNLNILDGRNTLGANDAFRLGPHICARVLFSDWKWWKIAKWDLEKYAKDGGIVYTVSPETERVNLPWLHQFMRVNVAVSLNPEALGWTHNTGCVAVNLAGLLGAKRVFLLGFDMTSSPKWGTTHWHNWRNRPTPPTSFDRFIKGFGKLCFGLKSFFPEMEVINVTDGISKLPYFPRVTPKEMEGMV